MSKSAPLGNLYIAGYDLSGDVGAIESVICARGLIDVTAINSGTRERLTGLRDGSISFTSWWDTATAAMFDALSTQLATDRHVMATFGVAAGSPAACCIGKQVDFALTPGADTSLSAKTQAQANAYGLDWGALVTVGKETFSAAGDGTAVLELSNRPPAVAIATSSVANPTHIASTAHGMVNGDSVLIAGHSGSNPAINGAYTVTRISNDEYTIPVNVSTGGTGGTGTKTSTNYGAVAYLQAFSCASGSATFKVKGSSDGSTYADVTGLAFAAVTGRTIERVATAATAIIPPYLRLNVAGTFGATAVAVVVCRNFG
jgi:hypothetical protein